MRYRYWVTYYIPVKTSWFGWEDIPYHETAVTRGDLQVIIDCINEDARVPRAFYEDVANGKVTHFKADFKPLP